MKILIVAGEASGDLHGSYLASSLLKTDRNIRLFGVGGSRMKQTGVSLYFDIKNMGIVGAVEIIGKLSFLKKVYNFLLSKINEGIFDAVILIDYPTMNLRLAKIARKKQIPVFYYISPQIWAWRKGRVKHIAKNVDKMIVILPFEKKFYKDAGVDVEFVGHPFVDIVKPAMLREEAFKKMGLDTGKRAIGLFPGSRKSELDSLLPLMLFSAHIIKNNCPDVQFLLAVAETVDRRRVDEIISKSFIDIKIVEGSNYDVMNVSDFLILASGSVTLEASFFGVPMVIIYKASFFTYFLARILVKVANIGLVNIVGGETVVPELIQNEATPQKIAWSALNIMNDPERYSYISKRLKGISSTLGEKGVCMRAADIILDYLNTG